MWGFGMMPMWSTCSRTSGWQMVVTLLKHRQVILGLGYKMYKSFWDASGYFLIMSGDHLTSKDFSSATDGWLLGNHSWSRYVKIMSDFFYGHILRKARTMFHSGLVYICLHDICFLGVSPPYLVETMVSWWFPVDVPYTPVMSRTYIRLGTWNRTWNLPAKPSNRRSWSADRWIHQQRGITLGG